MFEEGLKDKTTRTEVFEHVIVGPPPSLTNTHLQHRNTLVTILHCLPDKSHFEVMLPCIRASVTQQAGNTSTILLREHCGPFSLSRV